MGAARRPAATLGAVALLAAGASVAAAAPASAAEGREVELTFETTSLRGNAGVTSVQVRQVTHNGGSVERSAGSAGNGGRFPAYRASNPPLAVLAAVDTAGADELSPGTARFTFGADFAIDASSQGGGADNGNNLIQRGLFNAPMQYKVEVDGNRPSCRVKGSRGAVVVRSTRAVAPGEWYRATCDRDGATVTLTVTRLADGARWSYSRNGATGSLRAPSAATPLSVAGKVNARGSLVVSAPDQFNGRVDNAFYNVR